MRRPAKRSRVCRRLVSRSSGFAVDQQGEPVLEVEVGAVGLASLALPARGPCRSRPSSRRRSVVGWCSRSSSSMVVAAAADVARAGPAARPARAAGGRPGRGRCAGSRSHRAVATGADIDAALAGRLDPLGALGAHQAQDAKAGAEALLGMRLGGAGSARPRRRWTGRSPRPRASAARVSSRRSGGVRLGMCSAIVVCRPRSGLRTWQATRVPRWNSSTVCSVIRASIDLAHQAGWHGIQMSMQLDVVVEPGAAAAPLGVGVWFGRQRQQGALRSIASNSARRLAAEMAHRPVIEHRNQFADRARSARPARRTGDGAAGPAPNAAPLARQPRPWPCRAACAPAPAAWRCRNASPCPGRCG